MKFFKWIGSSNALLFAITLSIIVVYTSEMLSPYCPAPNHSEQGQSQSNLEKGSTSFFESVGGWIDRNHDDVEAISTLFVALFTIVLATFTVKLARATDKLVIGGTDSGERQLRAYISVTPKIVYNWPNISDGIAVGIIVKNHGRTPAFGISFGGRIYIRDRLAQDDFTPPDIVSLFNQNNAIFSDEELPVRFHTGMSITSEDFEAIESDKKRIYTEGGVTYRDAFRKTRTTKFAFSFGGIDFAKSMRGEPEARWDWEYGHSHNDGT